MILAITGGRYAPDGSVLRVPVMQLGAFLFLVRRLAVVRLVSGHAIGTDQHIERVIATQRPSILIDRYPVDPALDGPWPKAGHRRNRRMLRTSGAQGLVAFPGGSGTAGCISEAMGMGLRVWEWQESRQDFVQAQVQA